MFGPHILLSHTAETGLMTEFMIQRCEPSKTVYCHFHATRQQNIAAILIGKWDARACVTSMTHSRP